MTTAYVFVSTHSSNSIYGVEMKTTAHKHNVHEMLFVMMVILSVVTGHLIMRLILVSVMNIQLMHN